MIHVYPLGDLKPHSTDGKPCWCGPDTDTEPGLAIHVSMDGREDFETGKRKAS